MKCSYLERANPTDESTDRSQRHSIGSLHAQEVIINFADTGLCGNTITGCTSLAHIKLDV